MNVRELIEALQRIDPDLDVTVRTEDQDGNSFCGGIRSVSAEMTCDRGGEGRELFCAIDCDDFPDDEFVDDETEDGDGR
jgi:hypothetical protein